MEPSTLYGLYLYQKEKKDLNVLKDLLQLLRTQNVSKNVSFAYIEAQTSLIPNLSLWENIQLVSGGNSWKELYQSIEAQWHPLLNLIKNPNISAQTAQPWERFLTSLLKGLASPSKNLLIDLNEDLFPPLMIQNLKGIFLQVTEHKTIYLASNSPTLWQDCAHSLVSRDNYEFKIEKLDFGNLKNRFIA